MTEQSQQLATRIQDEHARLEQIIQEIRDELNRPIDSNGFGDWKLGFVWKIRDFQNELTKHFDLEEDGGFMEDVISRAPRFAPQIKTLEEEHIDAVKRLDDITARLKQLSAFDAQAWSEVSDEIMALFDSLEEHEAAERDLILEVYFQDIGVGD
jgi:hemerythrin-like domain-containing protein